MRQLILVLILGGSFASGVGAQAQKPITVIVVAVPSNQVSTYSKSTIGEDFKQACHSLTTLFNNPSVEVIPLCDPAKTTFTKVDTALTTYFRGKQTGKLTLLFVMAHGEVTSNNDIRLLLSDANDDHKDDHSLMLKERLVALITNAKDSVTVAFIDACYSGKAGGLLVQALGDAAEHEGTHVGLLVSSLPDEQAYAALFTKTLIDIWKNETTNECPHNSAELSSALLSRLGSVGTTPNWLISFHDSLCFNDLLNPDKRIISIWRDSNHKDPFQIQLFDDKGKHKEPIRTIDQDRVFANPYVFAVSPGNYRIETHGKRPNATSNDFELLDEEYCDFASQPYCNYSFPHSEVSLVDGLNIQREIYRSAVAHGYSPNDLAVLSNDIAEVYASLLVRDPAAAGLQQVHLEVEDENLWKAMQGSYALSEEDGSHNEADIKPHRKTHPPRIANVWVDYETQTYHFEHDDWFGRPSGGSLTEGEAIAKGFRPAEKITKNQVTVYYPSGNSDIIPAHDKNILAELAQTAVQLKGALIEVLTSLPSTGESDIIQERSDAITKYLIQNGVLPERIVRREQNADPSIPPQAIRVRVFVDRDLPQN